jgi:hypothetical protein
MAVAIHNASGRAGRGQSAARILFVAVFFAALVASAGLVGYRFVARPIEKPIAPDQTEQYRGVIQLEPDARGQCERLDFDNRSGAMRRHGAMPCSVETAAPARTTGAAGPFRGVRDYFRR